MPRHFLADLGDGVRPTVRCRTRRPNGDDVTVEPSSVCGRAEPAPPREVRSKVSWPCGGKLRDYAEGGFLGGAHSVRPCGKAIRMPRHLLADTGTGYLRRAGVRGEWPYGDGVSVRHRPVYGRAEPAPPRRGRSRRRWPGGEKPGNVARRRFSRRGALCAPALRCHTKAGACHYPRWVVRVARGLKGPKFGFT